MTETQAQNAAGETAAADTISLRIERWFDAPRELVFKAWTDPEHLAKWWGPEGVTIPVYEVDARVGGKFRTCMAGPDGSENWVQGVYREVEPPRRLVFTWAWEEDGVPGHQTLVTVELSDANGGTNLVLTHEGFETEESCQKHNSGWSSSLNCLEKAL
jgi:uncharacterized protein YndB with AHSA1/START domain